jgi:membrane-associated phospholipid phosphatase
MTTREATSEAALHPPERPAATAAGQLRHPVDLVRAALGLGVVGLGVLVAQQGRLSLVERDLFRLVNDLPGIVFPAVWTVMQLGNVVAVPTLAAMAALTRRYRMARDLLISGLLAYGLADLVKTIVGRERPADLPVGAVLHEGAVGGAGFVSGHAAVAAALATAAAPYLGRRSRRAVWTLAWSVAVARVYVGAHLPLDVVGGAAAGWAVGSLVHWALGVPRWEPSVPRVAGLLRRFGLSVRSLGPAAVAARSSHPFDAVDSDGRRRYVKVLDPDRFERDWLYRLYRLLAVRDIKDADAVAPLGQQAEHEAVAAMTARERGVRVPAVILARGTDRGAVVVQEYVVGRALDDLPAAERTPALLKEVWQQVVLLHAARIGHHDLVASNVLVDDAGRPWLVDFGNALTGAEDEDLASDVAELMASLAMRTDVALVVDSALSVLGPDSLAAALPGLAPLTRSAVTRAEERAAPGRLSALRDEVRRRLELPDPSRPEFPPAGLLAHGLVGLGVAAVLVGLPLLAGAGGVLQSVEVDGWRWLGGAVVLAFLARAATAAACLVAVGRRLALGRTYGAMILADGATLVHGDTGRRLRAARFLERAGLRPGDANRAIDRFSLGTTAAAAVVAVGTLVGAAVSGRLAGWYVASSWLPVLLLGLGAWALVLAGQWLALRRAGDVLPTVTPEGSPGPWPWAAQVAWSVLGLALSAATFAAALQAVGGRVPLLATVTVVATLQLLWSIAPVTAAPGAADVALVLALAALGGPLASACAAVITFRLLTFWIPAALGSLLSASFEHRLFT